MTAERVCLSAPWVVVDSATILRDGAVVTRHDRIEWVGPSQCAPAADRRLHLAPGILLPGLVNAHAHLDLTALGGELSGEGGLLAWLLQLIPKRARLSEAAIIDGVQRGIRESLAGGATTVADIDSFGRARAALCQSGIRAIALRELLGRSADDEERGALLADTWLTQPASTLVSSGLSPHAPYSAGSKLFARAAQLAAERSSIVASHVAETQEECDLFERGTGALVEFLAWIGAAPFPPPACRPVPWLNRLGVLSRRFVIIHGNYLTPADIACLAQARASVVYCPRSHAFFGHPRHPVAELRAAHVNLALGTDSLASNQSLSMLEEAQFVRRARPDLSDALILDMATRGGADALGIEAGLLRPGYLADVIGVVSDAALVARDVVPCVVSGAPRLALSLVGGRLLWHDSNHVTVSATAGVN